MKHLRVNDRKQKLAALMVSSAAIIEEMETTIKSKVLDFAKAETTYKRQGEISKEIKALRAKVDEETRNYNRLKDQYDLTPDQCN